MAVPLEDPGFHSQHPHGRSELPVTPVPRDSNTGLHKHCTHMTHSHIHREKIHRHKNKIKQTTTKHTTLSKTTLKIYRVKIVHDSKHITKTEPVVSSRKTYRWPTNTWQGARTLLTRELQVRTERHHVMPIRTAMILNTKNSPDPDKKGWCWCGETGPVGYYWWGWNRAQLL